jgi:hypothetical protein
MAFAHTRHKVDRYSSLLSFPRALLLLTIANMLTACGGGPEPASGGSSGGGAAISCTSGSSPAVLTWDPVDVATYPDLAGYRIYYGTAPGTYQQPVGGGDFVPANATIYSVMGLTKGTTYYFSATAFDGSNNESIFSNEICRTIS